MRQNTEFFLEAETNHKLWQAEIDGVKLWPGIRYEVKRILDWQPEGLVHKEPPKALRTLHPQLWQKHLRTISFFFTPTKPPQFDTMVVIWSNDHIYRYIFQHIANPLILESTFYGDSTSDNWGRYSTLLHDTLKIYIAVRSKLIRLKLSSNRMIDEFVEHVTDVFEMPRQKQRYVTIVSDHIKRYHILKPILYNRLLPRIRSKIVFLSIAAYMERKAVWAQLLHEADYTVVEAQHGIIGRHHIAYNYPPSVLNNRSHPAHLYLPDELWMFGQYWAEQAEIPSSKQIVGYPRLSEHLRKIDMEAVQKDKQILIVSQWPLAKEMVELTTNLAKALPDYHVVYKMHPIETKLPDQYQPLRDQVNIEIAYGGNIHEWIAESAIIVGHSSTVLFEALAFDGKRIFSMRNDFIDEHLFPVFENVDDLVVQIKEGKSGFRIQPAAYYWHENPDREVNQALKQNNLI